MKLRTLCRNDWPVSSTAAYALAAEYHLATTFYDEKLIARLKSLVLLRQAQNASISPLWSGSGKVRGSHLLSLFPFATANDGLVGPLSPSIPGISSS